MTDTVDTKLIALETAINELKIEHQKRRELLDQISSQIDYINKTLENTLEGKK